MDVTELVELVGVAAAVAGSVGSAVWAVYRFGGRVCRVVTSVDHLHDLFGNSPVAELHRIVSGIRSTVGELEVRQRIAERHLAIGIYVCGADGKCNWANSFLCGQFGLDLHEMLGYGWMAAVANAERIRVHAAWESAVTDDIPYEDRYTVIPKDGGESWEAMTEAWPIKVGDKVVCYVGYVTRDEATT